MSEFPQRKSPRLQGYDYSLSGGYFITICTHQRRHLFGAIRENGMNLSDAGKMAAERWHALPNHHSNIELDAFVVMPNHIHGVLFIMDEVIMDKAGLVPTEAGVASGSLGATVGSYKASVTRQIRRNWQQPDLIVWQSRYHDHIIRNEKTLNYIRNYVIYNPELWLEDKFYSPV